MKKHKVLLSILLSGSVIISACGGGGGDENPPNQVTEAFDELVYSASPTQGEPFIVRRASEGRQFHSELESSSIEHSLISYNGSPPSAGSADVKHVAVVRTNATSGNRELLIDDIKVSGDVVPFGQLATDAQWSPDGTKLAFLATLATNNIPELYVVEVGGTATTPISAPLDEGYNIFYFEWSPNSEYIAYATTFEDFDGANDAYTVQVDDASTAKLIFGVPAPLLGAGDGLREIVWSPDSTRLAFTADYNTPFVQDLYTIDVDGNNPISVTTLTDNDDVVRYSYSWSSTSNKLAFRVQSNPGGGAPLVAELYSVDRASAVESKLNGGLVEGGSVRSYQWSPNGSRLAYIADQEIDGLDQLYAMVADPTGNPSKIESGDLHVSSEIKWSPDSRKIAFRVVDGEDTNAIYRYDIDDQETIPLVTEGDFNAFSWSPNSDFLVYLSSIGIDDVISRKLFTVQANGGGIDQLNSLTTSNGNIIKYQWAPLGQHLAYIENDVSNGTGLNFTEYNLFTIRLEDENVVQINSFLGDDGDVFDFDWL